MTAVVHLNRRLTAPPDLSGVPGVRVRNYAGPEDIERWLEVRRRAFARERVGVREWRRADFAAEFLAKPWWRPDWLWLAETVDDPSSPGRGRGEGELAADATRAQSLWQGEKGPRGATIGTVALAMRGAGETALPVIHWLAVAPGWRRRGVARLLVATLEAAAWRAGYREVHLESHAAWIAALSFYESLGYRSDSV